VECKDDVDLVKCCMMMKVDGTKQRGVIQEGYEEFLACPERMQSVNI